MWIALLVAVLQSVGPSLPVQAPAQQSPPAQVSAAVILSFPWGGSDLTPALRRQLDDAIATYRRGEPVSLYISGPVNRGPSSCCMGNARRRESVVRAYLLAADVTDADIVEEAFGVEMPRADHAQILIAFGPGASF